MQRRSFFGVLAGIGSVFGLVKTSLSAPITDLPIVLATADFQIANVDELFRGATVYRPDGKEPLTRPSAQIVKVYLPLETARKLLSRDCSYYGPVYLRRSFFEDHHPDTYFCFHRTCDSIQALDYSEERQSIGMRYKEFASFADILVDAYPNGCHADVTRTLHPLFTRTPTPRK